MTAIVIKIGRGCSTAEKRALIDNVSRCVADSLGVVQRNVSVVLDESPLQRADQAAPAEIRPGQAEAPYAALLRAERG